MSRGAAFTLRRLLRADAAPYRDLRLRALREHPAAFTSSAEEEAERPLSWSAERLAQDAARPHDFFLGAFGHAAPAECALIGMAGLVGRYRPKERHNATLVGMYVAPEAAGAGVGAALVQELLRMARALPVLELVDLTVTEGNGPAQALYARCGFVLCGRLAAAVRIDGRYHAKLQMQCQLRPHPHPREGTLHGA